MGIKVKRNLNERVTDISETLNIPKITVESVIREYLEGLIKSAQNGETVVIDNIISIKVIESKEGRKLRGRVSPSLKNKVINHTPKGVGL